MTTQPRTDCVTCESDALDELSQLAAIFAALPTGVLVLNGAGVIVRANIAALTLLGEPLVGAFWREVIARSFAPRADDGHEVSLQDGRRVQLTTEPLAKKQGQLVFLNDLTQTRQLQDRVNHLKRLSALGNIAATLAHQIRTPLSAAMLYAANLGNSTLKAPSRQLFQQKLMSRLNELEKQISDILLFAKSDQQHVVSPLALTDLFEQVKQSSEAFCLQQDCLLHLDCPPANLYLLANPHALIGAINNLIANGQQAGASELWLQLQVYDRHVEITLIDNGQGIAPHQLAQIFEPFFTTKSQGTGLGLAVVHSVVQAHQGQVSVTSQVGQGTCFKLSLPLHQMSMQLGGAA